MDPLSKQIQALTWSDIEEVCRIRMPESETLEFKREVPYEKGDEPWSAGCSKLTTYAKRKILKEVVAFSNSYGGRVLLGVDEIRHDPPPRASEIRPIPSIGALELTISDLLRESLDPRHDRLLARAILDPSDETSGVIVIEAPQSPHRPHRSGADGEVYVRIGTSSTAITMREVHDRVLLREVEMNRIEKLFEARRLRVPSQVGSETPLTFIRFVAIPAFGDLRLTRPYLYKEVRYKGEGRLRIDGRPANSCRLPLQINGIGEPIPILRGSRRTYREHGTSRQLSDELNETGIIQIDYVEGRGEYNIDEWTLLGFVVHGLSVVDQVRGLANNPSAEYVVEVELAYAPITDGHARILPATRFPVISILGQDLAGPLKTFYDDLRNLRGQPHTESFEVEWCH